MTFDTHIHSKASSDSEALPTDIIKSAGDKGLGVIFTEHYDADCKASWFTNLDADAYMTEYKKYRSDSVLLGIEIGLTGISADLNKSVAADYPFDFCLGAVHMIDELDIYEDLCLSGKPTVTGPMYFDYLIKMTKGNIFYDSLAHIDYPHRYIGNNFNFSFESNADRCDIIFKNLIEHDISFEINTKRLGDKDVCKEMAKLYKRYSELGGKFVTIGTDAHEAHSIGRNLDAALLIVKECNLTPVYYKERRRVCV